MTLNTWTPKTWSEFIGETNRPYIERLQTSAIRRAPPRPVLLIAPFGGGKSALGDFLIKSHACPNITPTGDPCHACYDCQIVLPAQNGMGQSYLRYTEDCHLLRTDRERLIDVLDVMQQEDKVAVFFDELHGLGRNLNLLLTVLPKFQGIFVAAIKDTEYHKLPPELFDRFRKVWLQIPTVDELVQFFCNKAGSLGIKADALHVGVMVEGCGRSFRTCLDILQAALDRSPAVLDRRLLEEFFDLDPSAARLLDEPSRPPQ